MKIFYGIRNLKIKVKKKRNLIKKIIKITKKIIIKITTMENQK
jgi:hypothetical protein